MRPFLALLLLFITASCLDEANCYITTTNFVKVALKNKSDNGTATVSFNSIRVANTSLIAYADEKVTAVALPVNPNATETTFIFNYKSTVGDVTTDKIDTLTVSYGSEVRIISADCGAYEFYNDLAITNTDFTKTKLVNSSLLTTVASNLEIYF